jgi:hypothetical protein
VDRVGRGQTIDLKGEGLLGMCLGERRRLIVPPGTIRYTIHFNGSKDSIRCLSNRDPWFRQRKLSYQTLKGLGHEIEFNFWTKITGLFKNLYWFFELSKCSCDEKSPLPFRRNLQNLRKKSSRVVK